MNAIEQAIERIAEGTPLRIQADAENAAKDAELARLREKLRRYQLYYDGVFGYKKLAQEFGACEHPESSVWLTEWLNKILMRDEAQARQT